MISSDNGSSSRLKQPNTINHKQMILYTNDASLPPLAKMKFTPKRNTERRTIKSLSSIPLNKSLDNQSVLSPQYSESFISNSDISKTETDSFSKKSSIYSNDYFDSSSNIANIRQRTQLTNLISLDLVQSSASFIYPNLKLVSSGYFFNRNINTETNSIYIFSITLLPTKNMPLIFLGSEYFLRKSINFERLNYPLSKSEDIEPLIDLFLNRPQFKNEIPKLNNLSSYRFLPQTVSALLFFDSSFHQSARHLCHQLRTKENKNKFTTEDLLHMSQRENNIIQINALNDKRYHAFQNELTHIYYYENSRSSFKHNYQQRQSKVGFLEKMTRATSPIQKHSRIKTRSPIVNSISP